MPITFLDEEQPQTKNKITFLDEAPTSQIQQPKPGIETFARNALGGFADIHAGMQKSFGNLLDTAGYYTHIPQLQQWGQQYQQVGQDISNRYGIPNEGFNKSLYGGIGQAAVDVPKLMSTAPSLGLYNLAAWGAAEANKASPGVGSALMGAVQGGATQGVLHGLNVLPSFLKYPAAAGVGYATAGDGTQQDKLANAAVFAGLSAGKSPSMGEFVETQKQYGLPKQTETARNSLASGLIKNIIRPTDKSQMYGKDPAGAISREGIVANNLGDLKTGVQSKLDILQGQVDNIVKDSKKVINLKGVDSPLDVLAEKAVEQNNTTLLNQINELKTMINRKLVTVEDNQGNKKIQVGNRRNLENVGVQYAIDLKRLVGSRNMWNKESPQDSSKINSALRQVYHNINSRIGAAEPLIKELNSREADLISAKMLVDRRMKLQEKQGFNVGSYSDFKAGGIGAILGLPFHQSGVGGLTAIAIEKSLQSPAIATRVANWLQATPYEQKKTIFQKYPQLKTAIVNKLSDIKKFKPQIGMSIELQGVYPSPEQVKLAKHEETISPKEPTEGGKVTNELPT